MMFRYALRILLGAVLIWIAWELETTAIQLRNEGTGSGDIVIPPPLPPQPSPPRVKRGPDEPRGYFDDLIEEEERAGKRDFVEYPGLSKVFSAETDPRVVAAKPENVAKRSLAKVFNRCALGLALVGILLVLAGIVPTGLMLLPSRATRQPEILSLDDCEPITTETKRATPLQDPDSPVPDPRAGGVEGVAGEREEGDGTAPERGRPADRTDHVRPSTTAGPTAEGDPAIGPGQAGQPVHR